MPFIKLKLNHANEYLRLFSMDGRHVCSDIMVSGQPFTNVRIVAVVG